MRAVITHDQLEVQDEVLYNSGSIDYYEIDTEFTSDWDNLTKYAIINGAEAVKIPVVANKVKVDRNTSGTYTIGFVGYTLEDDEKTYQISTNLEYIYFQTGAGEIEANEPSDLPDPTTWETYLSEIQAIVNGAENVNITAEKNDKTTYINVTDKTGTTKTVEVLDGENGEGVAEGGTAGQVLKKKSNDDFDTEWGQLDKSDVGLNNVDNIRQYSGNNPPPYPVRSVNGQTGDVTIFVPVKLSDLSNDTGFITNLVDNLANYYLKTEIYTKQEVTTLINAIQKVTITIVDELPATGDSNVIYFVPKTDSGNDTYNEYIYINNSWEKIGDTDVDLSNYYTKSQTDTLLNNKANVSAIPTKTSELTNDSNFEVTTNKVTSLSSGSTNTQYPSAKCVYDLVGNVESALTTLDVGNGVV